MSDCDYIAARDLVNSLAQVTSKSEEIRVSASALRAARLDGMRRAREAVVKIPCVGMAYHWTPGCNASISAIDRLIAEAEKGDEPTAEETER